MSRILRCGARTLDLAEPRVMGVLNISPDSFSDGGRYWDAAGPRFDRVLRRADQMQRQGAAILDIGGESTRPGATPVPEQQEIERVLPVVRALAARFDIIFSVDTSSPALMREAAAAGAGMINDVRALRRPGALDTAAAGNLAVCLMHMQGAPQTMQQDPTYDDVVGEVGAFLSERTRACEAAGIARERLLIDPGFGFGKSLQHNLRLFSGLKTLAERGVPLLIGVSKKSMIGATLNRGLRGRVAGGLALAALAVEYGVAVVRTHDVRATADVLRMVAAVKQAR
jgi:dihydropteroate synthase